MAVTPIWKVYLRREYVAAFKHPAHAVAFAELISSRAAPASVRYNHKNHVWEAGIDNAASYDEAARIMQRRLGRVDL